MLSLRTIKKSEEFQKFQDPWNELLSQSGLNNVFLTWEWLYTWWTIFGKNHELQIITCWDNNQLVGIAPFYIRERNFLPLLRLKEILILGCGESVRSEYMDLITLPQSRPAFIQTLLESLSQKDDWDIATFHDVRRDFLFSLLAAESELIFQNFGEDTCYYIKMPQSFEEYLLNLDCKMRRNIRNRRRNLQRDFSTAYHRLELEEERLPWMQKFKTLHMSRMQQKGLPGKFVDPGYELFHLEISKIFLEKGWLFASDLRLNGEIAACRYNFIYNRKVYDHQTGFNPQFSRNGVMQVLLSYLIEDCIKQGVSEFDFLAVGEDYKRRLSNAARQITTIRILNHTSRARNYQRLSTLKSIWQAEEVHAAA